MFFTRAPKTYIRSCKLLFYAGVHVVCYALYFRSAKDIRHAGDNSLNVGFRVNMLGFWKCQLEKVSDMKIRVNGKHSGLRCHPPPPPPPPSNTHVYASPNCVWRGQMLQKFATVRVPFYNPLHSQFSGGGGTYVYIYVKYVIAWLAFYFANYREIVIFF